MINAIKKLSTKNVFLIFALFMLIYMAWGIFMSNLIQHLPNPTGFSKNTNTTIYLQSSLVILIHVPIKAMFEEFLFRTLPLGVIIICINLLKASPKAENILIVSTMTVSSIVFGYVHGNILNIFVQGVGGFMMSIIFLAG
jgi:membrane protease YdiL (CAAX protease family)